MLFMHQVPQWPNRGSCKDFQMKEAVAFRQTYCSGQDIYTTTWLLSANTLHHGVPNLLVYEDLLNGKTTTTTKTWPTLSECLDWECTMTKQTKSYYGFRNTNKWFCILAITTASICIWTLMHICVWNNIFHTIENAWHTYRF